MKKSALITVFILSSIIVNAQIVLENTYPSGGFVQNNLTIVKLSSSGYKYSLVDTTNKQLTLYNLNHSVFKTITIPVQSLTSYFVLYISETLFDTDPSDIEYLVFPGISAFNLRIFDETGATLFSLDSATLSGYNAWLGYNPIFNTDSGTKMMLIANDGNRVYSLPGTLQASSTTTDNYNLNKLNKTSLSYPYPNPSNNFTTIDYKLPEGINHGEIVIYNIQGKEIKRYKVDKTFDHLRISAYELPAGNYYFNLRTSRGISEGKKMIVIK